MLMLGRGLQGSEHWPIHKLLSLLSVYDGTGTLGWQLTTTAGCVTFGDVFDA